jgi:hypothetical protein
MNLKSARSFSEVSTVLNHEAALWHADEVLPGKALCVTPAGEIEGPRAGPLTLTPWAKQQLASVLGIRWEKWFGKVSGEEAAEEINRRLSRSEQSFKLRTRMPRAGENENSHVLAALVSESYTPIADTRVWNNLSRVVGSETMETLKVIPPEFTDRSTHLCVLADKPIEVRIGNKTETYYAGFYLRNSQVGFTALTIDIYFLRLVCVNGLMVAAEQFRLLYRTHRPIADDVLGGLLDKSLTGMEDRWTQGLNLLDAASSQKIADTDSVLGDLLRQVPGMRHLKKAISEEMAQGGDGSAFGLIQAMTHVAQGLAAPDQRFELERLAGRLLTSGDFGGTPAAVIATA